MLPFTISFPPPLLSLEETLGLMRGMTAIARALSVPELVGCIVDAVADDLTLLQLSITSKTFLELALDKLWREIDNLKPLIDILGSTDYLDETEALVR